MSDVAVASAIGPARNGAFQTTVGMSPRRSMHDLSHERKFAFDFGQLIPSLVLEMMPGDHFEMSADIAVRFQAMLAPPLHQVDLTVHYFFVPNRLLWPKVDNSGNDWETYITGGVSGTNAAVLPRWNVSSGHHDVGSLWDCFGLPPWATANDFATAYPDAIQPYALPLRAYNLIWDEYYRDETLQNVVGLTGNEDVLVRNWTKDFFTSALPWQQRGTAPALPISGTLSTLWPGGQFVNGAAPGGLASGFSNIGAGTDPHAYLNNANAVLNMNAFMNTGTVSLNSATTFNISDFRLAAVIQRWLERNATGGIRYTEFLQSMFGTHPKDERLQRPEYVGGIKQPVIFSEVLQTSPQQAAGVTTPQGNMAGHGLSVNRNYVGKYTAVEFGFMIGVMSVMPVPAYQQGIAKQWSKVSRYDWPFPDFANLSEQTVLNQEVYLTGDGANQSVFGYQGRYNEYRYEKNMVSGLFRTVLNYWHFGRIFGARPALNSAFIQLGAAEVTSLKRVAQVPSQPLLLCSVGNNVRAVRPIPDIPEPGIFRV